jgi:hypothetical protein
MDAIRFSQSSGCRQLYMADCGEQRVAFLLPRGAAAPAPALDLAAAWASNPAGCYLFLPAALAADAHAAFAAAAWSFLGNRSRAGARLAWFENPGDFAQGLRGHFIALYQAGGEWRSDRATRFDFGGISLLLAKNSSVAIAPDGAAFRIGLPSAGGSALQTPAGTRYPLDAELTLPICGALAGCLRFNLTLDVNGIPAALQDLDVGLRIFVRDSSFPTPDDQFYVTSLRYPIISQERQESPEWTYYRKLGGSLRLYATLDPLNQLDGDRTYFSFASPAGDARPQELPSCFRTNLGYTIHLTPRDHRSRLVFAPRPTAAQASAGDPYYLVPSGEFAMTVPRYSSSTTLAAPDSPVYPDNLLCGLSGVEYVKLDLGSANMLCFRPGGAAFAPGFILGEQAAANGVGALTDLASTAWAYVRQSDESPPIYYAQPDQAVLYQPDSASESASSQGALLSYLEVPAATLPDPGDRLPPAFPLFPYGGVQADPARGITLSDYQQIEIQRLTPTRRSCIHDLSANSTAAQPRSFRATLGPDESVSGTTPQGLLASFSGDYEIIQKLILAKDTDDVFLTFEQIERDSPLRTALQSNQLFLVISDPAALQAYFTQSRLTIQGWAFDLDPARWQQQGTLLIFKFHEKSLAELAQDTQMWALPKAFNARPDATRRRLATLLQDALARDADSSNAKDRENYRQLAKAAGDPSWSGIIALNVALAPSTIPDELLALSAGINKENFYAQYLGIETTPITPLAGQLVAGQSSLFGLIDYQDDTAPTATESGYNFQVTRLQVLFQNSQVKAFASDISVTLDRLFDEPTQLLGSATGRNLLVFKGSAENHDGKTTYAFSFSGDNHFALPASHVLNEVEIIKAQFSTDPVVRPINHATAIVGRFTFWGRLNFRRLEKFDVLSFGADAPIALPPDAAPADAIQPAEMNDQFLSFSNLLVTMSFQLGTPAERSFAFDPRNLGFDLRRSKVRAASLYAKFPLKFTGLIYAADDDRKLDDFGYMPVKTPLGGAKIAGTWYGLTFDLDLGSVGALAGKAGLVASILVAWSPGKDAVFVGLRLPGSSGGKREIAIQGVLKIVFKGIEFVVGDNNGQVSYLLKLKNIMIKFLVLSIPPSGQTEIIIFGDPQSTAENNSVGWYAAYAKAPLPPPKPPSPLPGQ